MSTPEKIIVGYNDTYPDTAPHLEPQNPLPGHGYKYFTWQIDGGRYVYSTDSEFEGFTYFWKTDGYINNRLMSRDERLAFLFVSYDAAEDLPQGSDQKKAFYAILIQAEAKHEALSEAEV